ncbi:MAG: hypothetical protein GWN58_20165, partial [Anaerolineae bacterium]|nr:hypothetical protein [Anaerolineae bacterium]
METSEAQKWREYQEWRREAHDAEVRRAEWERMYHQAVTDAGERVASLEAALEQIARWGSGE